MNIYKATSTTRFIIFNLIFLLITVSCNQNINQTKDLVSFLETNSTLGKFDQSQMSDVLNAKNIRHTFSNSEKIELFSVGDHLFTSSMDVAFSRRTQLFDKINQMEDNLKNQQVTSQGVGISPGALESSGRSALWPSAVASGIIYYDVGSFAIGLRPLIDQAIAEWNSTAVAIKWQPRVSGSTVQYSTFITGSNSTTEDLAVWIWGIQCATVPALSVGGIGYTYAQGFPAANTIYFNPDCNSNFLSNPAEFKATIQHEMGHVTGLWHEQQYCGRSKYINMLAQSGGIFDVNYFYNYQEKCDPNAKNYNSYDYTSNMHYGYSPAKIARKLDGPADLSYCGSYYVPGKALGLSSGDVAAINELYNRSANTPSSICGVNMIYEPYGFIQDNSVRLLASGSQIKLRVRANGYKVNNSSVTWAVTPNIGSYFVSPIPNSADVNFNYTAPSVSSPTLVTIKATSVQDVSKYTTATLNVKLITNYKELKRYYNPAPLNPYNTGDHWVTTGTVTSGYNLELFNGTLTSDSTAIYLRNTSDTPLYSCKIGNDHFISLQSNCEGQAGLGILGYIDATNSGPQSHVPIYRCYTGTDHFVSTDSQCEKSIAGNQTRINEGLLGYGITNP
jgi:Astacin (Peptidase family M12A)